MKQIYFNFYGETVYVQSDWSELLTLLGKDFSLFIDNPQVKSHLTILIARGNPGHQKIPEMVSKMQSLNSITYQLGHIRYNDYYGKLLSIFDYKNQSAQIISEDEDKTHEVAYLLMLSRVGKSLDLHGLHKLHAFAVSYKGIAFVCMMPMKGGKSTLLMELLKNKEAKMISDDIPLIDRLGHVHAFPIKIGVDDARRIPFDITNPEENIYQLNREQYGPKTFICLNGLKEKVELPGTQFDKVIIAEGFRYNADHSLIRCSSWVSTYLGLFKHGVIGIGLPMILEYFWEFGIKDFIIKSKIFLLRFYSFGILCSRNHRIKIQLGRKSDLSAKAIFEYLEGKL